MDEYFGDLGGIGGGSLDGLSGGGPGIGFSEPAPVQNAAAAVEEPTSAAADVQTAPVESAVETPKPPPSAPAEQAAPAPRVGAVTDNALFAMRYLTDKKGMNPDDAAAMVWNFQQESGKNLNTTLSHDGGTGYGIAGFRDTKPGVGRWTDLRNFAKSEGRDPADLTTQLDFAYGELNGSERGAWSRIQAAQTPEAKAQAAISFFRPAKQYAASRAQQAGGVNDLLSAFKSGGGADAPRALYAMRSAPAADTGGQTAAWVPSGGNAAPGISTEASGAAVADPTQVAGSEPGSLKDIGQKFATGIKGVATAMTAPAQKQAGTASKGGPVQAAKVDLASLNAQEPGRYIEMPVSQYQLWQQGRA
jgi:hypothetical protein